MSERTSKKWKVWQAVGVTIGAVGVVGTIGSGVAMVRYEVVWPAYCAFGLCAVGVCDYLVGTTAAWWYDG